MFCEIQVWYETGSRLRDGSYKFTYPNWNKAHEPEVFLNGSDVQLNPDLYEIDYKRLSICNCLLQIFTPSLILKSINLSYILNQIFE
jgi:hypothetical protein